MAYELNAKEFANRLNHCLDEMDAPALEKKRVDILVDLLNITKFDAQDLLAGRRLPNEELIERIASEFDVDKNWLAGKSKGSPHPSR